METSTLIRQLEADHAPVRALPRPWVRTLLWLSLAIVYIGMVTMLTTSRPDLALLLTEPRFQIELGAAFATAALAAVAAFTCVVPGRSRIVCLLPLVPLTIWLASLGQACFQDWAALGPDGLRLRIDWDCMPAAVVAGIIPAIAMVVMLRRGAPLFPHVALAMGALAVGAIANAGLQLHHVGDASIMVLVWHFGSVAALSLLAGWAGHRVLRWPRVIRARTHNS